MRLGVIIAALLGLAVATAVLGYIGFGPVLGALTAIGPRGLAFLCLYSAAPLILLGSAWFVVDPAASPRDWAAFVWGRLIRDAGSELLPFSHLGGFVIGARAAMLRGVGAVAAYSSTVVDVTTEIIAQIGFTALGLCLLSARLGAASSHAALVEAILVALALSAAAAAALIVLQRRGGGLLESLVARFVPAAAERAGLVARAVHGLYDRPWRVGAGVALHLAAWVASAAGAWLALRLSGVSIGLIDVLAIESLVGAARSAAFMAPMGIGVQEASYAVIGPLFGLGADLAVALSLLKRARDIAVGLPALILWQAGEGARLVGGRRAGSRR